MADTSHVHEVPRQGGWGCQWTPEEDAVLIQAWCDWVGPKEQARRGFLKHVASLFPHRSVLSIRARKLHLANTGRVAKQWQKVEYHPIHLSPSEASWLGGIIDGEGSLDNYAHTDGRRKRKYHMRMLRICVCYNNNQGILDRVKRLLPHVRDSITNHVGTDSRGIHTNKDVHQLMVFGFVPMLDLLQQVLPYMFHTIKREKALAMMEYIKGHLSDAR